MLFAGWALAATFLPRLGDIYGRRIIYIGAMIAHGIFYAGIILSGSRVLTTVFMFFLGMASVGRATVGYLYVMELVPTPQQTTVGTVLMIMNSVITIFSCIYFLYISK